MITVNASNGLIHVSIGEEVKVVKYDIDTYQQICAYSEAAYDATDLETYNEIVEATTAYLDSKAINTVDSIISTECPFIVRNSLTNKYYLTYRGEKKSDDIISDIPIPESLVERIMSSIDAGVSFLPVVKLWTRFLRNPHLKKKGDDFAQRFADFVNMKYVHPKLKQEFLDKGLDDEVATKLATIYQIKITNEGLLNGYKVSKEILHKYDSETGECVPRYARTFNVNTGEIESEGLPDFVEDRLFEPAVQGNRGDAFYSGSELGHFIRVGKLHKLESWDQVNCDDTRTCVPGLHIGGLYYINNYGGEIHNVFVDPMNIGAIPDSSEGAIRCLEYFVHSSLAGVNASMYHSSDYAKLTDLDWEKMREEILMSNLKKIETMQNEVINFSGME